MSNFSGSLGHSGKVETGISSPDLFSFTECETYLPSLAGVWKNARTYGPSFAVLPVPHVASCCIRQIAAELVVERKQRDLAALEPLPCPA